MADDHYNSSSASAMSPPAAAAEAAVVVGSSVIPIGNKPQNIFSQLGSSATIDLPQVSVVGSQSSGKSSVLDALVGRDILPRGSDICARRPLMLQLVHQPCRPADVERDEWDEFLHQPGHRFYEFPDIRCEIQARPWTRCSTAAPSIASTRSQVNGTSVVGRMSLMTSFHVEEHVPWYPRVASFYTCRAFYVYIAIFVIVWNIVWLSG